MADVNVTITVPDAWVNRVLTALNGQANKDIGLDFENAHKNYTYEAKTGEENNIQFAKRVFTEHLKQQIKIYELSLSYDEYRTAINNITDPFEDVPEDILT